MDKLEWSALEYEEKEKGGDWFLALGIIVVCSSVAAIIFGNYFFAILLVISGILLGFFAVRKPEMVPYELNSQGLKIRSRLYLYEHMRSFWVQSESVERNLKPMLFIRSERIFMPIISMSIENKMAEDVRSIMLAQNVPEEEMREHASQKIMEYLGF